MAFSHGRNAKLLLNGYDITSYFTSASISAEVETAETTVFGKTAKTYVVGLDTATFSAEGFYDGAAGAVDEILSSAKGASTPSNLTYYPAGDSLGSAGVGMQCDETNYEVKTDVGNVAQVSFEAQSNVGRERVTSLHALGQETLSSNSTAQDNASATANGGVGYIEVTAVGGTTPSLAAKVQHSVDNVTWVDLIAFTAVTANNKSERKEASGTVNRYVRSSWTLTGTSPTATFQLVFGRK